MNHMATKTNTHTWSAIKTKLADFDRPGLIQDLYAASKDNQAFLHTRLAPGVDVLKPFKATITRWINPPKIPAPISVAKAKKAITDYKKAVGRPEDLAELTVFYCEEVFAFLRNVGMEDDGYYDALVRMFEQAVGHALASPVPAQVTFTERLDRVRKLGQDLGWGVGAAFNDCWMRAGFTLGT
jgi:hypothetical protein